MAALLQDIESIEVTARVIRKAVGDLAHGNRKDRLEYTFNGNDLVQSLGSVLTGALPLLVDHGDRLNVGEADDPIPLPVEPAIGARILRHRAEISDAVARKNPTRTILSAAINFLKNDLDGDHHPAVVHALAQVAIPPAKPAPARELVEA